MSIKYYFLRKYLRFTSAKNLNNIAEKLIAFVGITVVLSIVSIAISLFVVSIPLFIPASSKIESSLNSKIADEKMATPNNQLKKISDLGQNSILTIYTDGRIAIWNSKEGVSIYLDPIVNNSDLKNVLIDSNNNIYSFYNDGVAKIRKAEFNNLSDISRVAVNEVKKFNFMLNANLIKANYDGENLQLVQQVADKIYVLNESQSKDFLGKITAEKKEFNFKSELEAIDFMLLSASNNAIVLASKLGKLEYWKIDGEAKLIATENINKKITAISYLTGENSIAVANSDNSIDIFDTYLQENKFVKRSEYKESNASEIVKLIPAKNNRVMLSQQKDGNLSFFYTTTDQKLLNIKTDGDIADFNLSDHLEKLYVLYENGTITVYNLNIKYPESSIKSYFGKITYESYYTPSYTWQSSASNNDFEPKLSLVPLIIGTIKGTFYAMLLVIPISVLGAIYLSQFASFRARKYLKPTVEMMASVPSVVIGFLAALWLGPYFERYFLHILLFILFCPLGFVIGFFVWEKLDKNFQNRITAKYTLSFGLVSLFLTVLMAYFAAWYLEQHQNVRIIEILHNYFGINYEQQNGMITAIALAFTSIPIVFSVADDSFRTVPKSFNEASLALGATRWQTVRNVLLPLASPGIFIALILGVSRTIGETMIVLMASGNTPITSFSIFSGMRTLSANIAVEIPEAPVNGTLYRTLFLSGLILFLMTFFLNLIAETVRSRLQKKYSRS